MAKQVVVGVVETIVGSLSCFVVGIVWCFFFIFCVICVIW